MYGGTSEVAAADDGLCRGRGWPGGSRRARRTAAAASVCSARRRSGVLLAEVQLAKRQVGGGVAPRPAAARTGGTGWRSPAPASRRCGWRMLGDSTAAGQGVRRAGQTPGALLASGLAAVAERPVELRNVALPGAQSDDLDRQVVAAAGGPGPAPDVCVIMIGANDVTHRMPPTQSVRLPGRRGAPAAHGGRGGGRRHLPGPGHDRAGLPAAALAGPAGSAASWPPRRRSRSVEQGGRTVSLGDLLGPEFAANPRELFGPDNYHPSAEGYATAAMAMLPTLCAALGLWPEADERPDAPAREGILPVAEAAAEAAREAGTEVTAALPPTAGPLGPASSARRRRRLPAADATAPAARPGSRRTAARRRLPPPAPAAGRTGATAHPAAGPGIPVRPSLSKRLEKSGRITRPPR